MSSRAQHALAFALLVVAGCGGDGATITTPPDAAVDAATAPIVHAFRLLGATTDDTLVIVDDGDHTIYAEPLDIDLAAALVPLSVNDPDARATVDGPVVFVASPVAWEPVPAQVRWYSRSHGEGASQSPSFGFALAASADGKYVVMPAGADVEGARTGYIMAALADGSAARPLTKTSTLWSWGWEGDTRSWSTSRFFGHRVWIAENQRTHYLVNLDSGSSESLSEELGGGGQLHGIVADASGAVLAVLSAEGTLALWNDAEAAPSVVATDAQYMALTPDGATLLYSTAGESLFGVATKTGMERQLDDRTISIRGISPDGQWLVSERWNPTGGTCTARPPAGGAGVILPCTDDFAFTPDVRYLTLLRCDDMGECGVHLRSLDDTGAAEVALPLARVERVVPVAPHGALIAANTVDVATTGMPRDPRVDLIFIADLSRPDETQLIAGDASPDFAIVRKDTAVAWTAHNGAPSTVRTATLGKWKF